MLTWLRRYIAWLFVALAVAGAVFAYMGWQRGRHLAEVRRVGVEAVALIEGAASVRRKNVFSYSVALAWKDADGKVHRAADVPVSAPFAERIIANGVLVIPSTEIRYLKGQPDRAPVISADAGQQRAAADRFVTYGLAGLLFGILGGLLFGLRWPWHRWKGAAT